MCLAPIMIPTGQEIACRNCWQCRAAKVDDWVGRNTAESLTARASHSITLTYGPDENGNEDHIRAKVLTYSDVQKFIKRLRKDGYPCRYFACGEYGDEKGRAHWHLMIYWLGAVPDVPLEKRFTLEQWKHGWAYFEMPHENSVRYICKYITKNIGKEGRQAKMAMSKKPPLGAAYFQQRANWYVDQGLAPKEPFYSFPDILDGKGNAQKFYLKGASREIFLRAYCVHWYRKHRKRRHMPSSELVEQYLDERARRRTRSEFYFEPIKRPLTKPKPHQMRDFMKYENLRQGRAGGWEYRVGRQHLWRWVRWPNGDDGWQYVDLWKLKGMKYGEETKSKKPRQ